MQSFFSEEKSRFAKSFYSGFWALTRLRWKQEFRAELQAAETKDKKFVKRKTVLKKVVANITMGNDSWYKFSV
jgi:hypothetical protein